MYRKIIHIVIFVYVYIHTEVYIEYIDSMFIEGCYVTEKRGKRDMKGE